MEKEISLFVYKNMYAGGETKFIRLKYELLNE